VLVITLTLGLRLRQRLARVWAKREAQKSHLMLPGVRKVWGNEPSHSHVNSHFGSWSPRKQLHGSKPIGLRNFFYHWKNFETKMFKMGLHDPFGHLKQNYGQKKGQQSNCQFDFRPLKVKNRPDFLLCRWHATYCWKVLDKGYNFVLDLISIRGLHTKL